MRPGILVTVGNSNWEKYALNPDHHYLHGLDTVDIPPPRDFFFVVLKTCQSWYFFLKEKPAIFYGTFNRQDSGRTLDCGKFQAD